MKKLRGEAIKQRATQLKLANYIFQFGAKKKIGKTLIEMQVFSLHHTGII